MFSLSQTSLRELPSALPQVQKETNSVIKDVANIRIGGMTRMTTIDYPGQLATVIYLQGCPWRCRYCHNHDLLVAKQPSRYDWSDIQSFLQDRSGLLDAVVFSGGEPLAQSALGDAITTVKEMGFLVGLHSGGALPNRLEPLLSKLDWIGLDIKGLPEDYPSITGIANAGDKAWESLALVLDSDINYEVRTTVMPQWTKDHLQRLMDSLAVAGVKNYYLQRCDVSRALDPLLERAEMPFQQLVQDIDTSAFEHFGIRN